MTFCNYTQLHRFVNKKYHFITFNAPRIAVFITI
ncbi:unknown [Prevotella sp. CAG:1185]|nr:unknown [Prevotella sp. CAG:1185]